MMGLVAGTFEGSFTVQILITILSVFVVTGVLRQARDDSVRPFHWTFVATLPIILLWNFPIQQRLLLLFLPLMFIGVASKASYLASATTRAFRRSAGLGQKTVAVLFAIGLLFLVGSGARNYFDRPALQEIARLQRSHASQFEQGAAWIRENTDDETRFIARADGWLHLLTGRRTSMPFAATTDAYYAPDARGTQGQFRHLMDAARHQRARYWVADDYIVSGNLPASEKRWDLLGACLPEVFRSSESSVRIYDLTPVLTEDVSVCGEALRELARHPPSGSL